MSMQVLKPKGWCKHMLWKKGGMEVTSFGNSFYNPEGLFLQMHREYASDWKFCPICGAKRPKKSKVSGE